MIRDVRDDDLAAIAAIVNHFIATTTVNFRTAPQTVADWRADWQAGAARFPWLAAEVDGTVAGVAYAGTWKPRAAYDRTVETTVYVAPDRGRRGIGRALYAELLARLDAAGFHTQIAVIALPNEPSVALHEAFGFAHVGTLREVGWKQDRWCDTGFWQRIA
jgi:phosphinothricin acetyltransferase